MYEYLLGLVAYVSPAYIVVETSKIGYQIQVANPYRYQEGSQIKIYLHEVMREDAHLLFGFYDLNEKELFLRLISVSGIGPKSALAILAGNDHEGLQEAVEREDVKYLTKFPGVGKKTAQQMILDLKGKLKPEKINEGLFAEEKAPKNALQEAMLALKALGYSEKEIKQIEKKVGTEELSTEGYISLGLKLLMKSR